MLLQIKKDYVWYESLMYNISTFSYHSTGGKFKKKASNNGTEQLSNPIQNTPQQSDVSTDEGTECHGRVHMSPRNVGTNWNRHKKTKRMG